MPLYLRSSERQPGPEPPVTDDRRTVLAGTMLWLVLLLVALLARDQLAEAGRTWWIWTCLTGAVLGVLGLAHLHRREVRRRSR